MDAALLHAEKMIKKDDILDVGGESTVRDMFQITDEEEIARVVPVIEKLKRNLTYRSLLIHIKARWLKLRFVRGRSCK